MGLFQRQCLLSILMLAGFCFPIRVQAQVLNWLYPGGAGGTGDFQTATNWSPNAVPGASSMVQFLQDKVTTVNFSSSATTTGYLQSQGSVTLNLTPSQTYTLTGNNGLTLDGHATNMTVSGGGLLHLTTFNTGLATTAGSYGTLYIQGNGTRFIADYWNDVGVQGNAVVVVQGGASYQTGGFSSIGLATNSRGQIAVYGQGTQFVSGPGMVIGNSGTGYLTVDDSSSALLGANTVLGVNPTGDGSIFLGFSTPAVINSSGLTIGDKGYGLVGVTNGSTMNNSGDIFIGAQSGSTGNLTLVSDSLNIFNQSGGSIYVGGTASGTGGTGKITVGAGSVLNVTGAGNGIYVKSGTGSIILDGGTINTPNLTGFASDLTTFSTPGLKQGILNINGGLFTQTNGGTNGSFFFNTSTGPVTINLNDGASFSPSNIWVGGYGSSVLNVKNGSILTSAGTGAQSGGLIGFAGSTTTSAVITIDGSGSKWITNPGSNIGIGGNIGSGVGSGTLALFNNGTLEAVGSTIGVGSAANSTGILNVDFGTINSGSIYVGGSASGPAGTGSMRVGNNSTINIIGSGNGLYVYPTLGSLTLDGGTINTPNLTLSDSQVVNNTLLKGTINIEGGTLNRGNHSLILASNTGNLTVNLLNGATTTALLNVFVGNANGNNYLNVQSGSQFNTATSSLIGYGGSTVDSAVVTVAGSGSVWNANNYSIYVGGSYGGPTGGGTVNVRDGAFIFGAFDIILGSGGTGATGVFNISNSSGVFSSFGEIASAPGSVGKMTLGSPPGAVSSAWYVSDTLAVGGNLSSPGGTGIVTINSGGLVNVPTVTLWTDGQINLNGGILQLSSLAANGGAIQFNAGQISFLNDWKADYQQLSAVLGLTPTVRTGQFLGVNGATTLYSVLTLDGGTFSTGSISGGSLLHLNKGSFNLVNSDLVIGSGGTLGANLNLPEQMRVNLLGSNNVVQINADGRLFLNGGTLSTNPTSPGIVNNGQIQLLNPQSQMTGGPLANNGLLLGSGQISSSLTNQATGTIRVNSTDRLVFTGTSNINNGNINLVGGTVEFLGQLTNSTTGAVTGRGTIATSSGTPGSLGLINNGVLLLSSGNTDIYGDVQNNAGARIVTSGAGITTFYDDVVHNGAEIRTNAGSRTVFFGSQSGAGNFTGAGTVEYNGDYRPGNSPANVHYEGSVVFTSTAGLFIELGGTQPGSQFDRITVQGNIDLAGQLDLHLINGFTPQPGDAFMIIDNQGIGALNGTFTGLAEGSVFMDDGSLFQITYHGGDGNDLVITAVPEPATMVLIGASVALSAAYAWRRYRLRHQFMNSWISEAGIMS